MGSVNKVILVGNVGKDPEVRSLQNGDKVVSFSVATSETWKDRQSGERKKKTEWSKVVIFNENHAKFAEGHLKKGSTVYIEGSLQTRKWTDNAGVEKYSTEVVLQKFRGEITLIGGKPSGGGDGYDETPRGGSSGKREAMSAVMDDEIPFLTSRSIW